MSRFLSCSNVIRIGDGRAAALIENIPLAKGLGQGEPWWRKSDGWVADLGTRAARIQHTRHGRRLALQLESTSRYSVACHVAEPKRIADEPSSSLSVADIIVGTLSF